MVNNLLRSEAQHLIDVARRNAINCLHSESILRICRDYLRVTCEENSEDLSNPAYTEKTSSDSMIEVFRGLEENSQSHGDLG